MEMIMKNISLIRIDRVIEVSNTIWGDKKFCDEMFFFSKFLCFVVNKPLESNKD